MTLRRYRRRERTTVTAVRLDLDLESFTYHKWGSLQRASRGDWLVDTGGDVHTVAADTFARTYRKVGEGRYEKVGDVWARIAESAGTIETQEGRTRYQAGDVIVFNDPDGTDGYAMSRSEFERRYEPAE